jgi:hypothetical protein
VFVEVSIEDGGRNCLGRITIAAKLKKWKQNIAYTYNRSNSLIARVRVHAVLSCGTLSLSISHRHSDLDVTANDHRTHFFPRHRRLRSFLSAPKLLPQDTAAVSRFDYPTSKHAVNTARDAAPPRASRPRHPPALAQDVVHSCARLSQRPQAHHHGYLHRQRVRHLHPVYPARAPAALRLNAL